MFFGNPAQLGLQAVGVIATIAYSGAGTYAVLKLVALVIPLRADNRAERAGTDVTQHGEEAYANGEGAVLVLCTTTRVHFMSNRRWLPRPAWHEAHRRDHQVGLPE